jgi:tetratricopeptide (TPR) repeat protein
MKDKKRNTNRLARILTQEELSEYKKNKDSLIDFGYEYMDLGDYKKAFQIFSMVIRISGDDPDSLNGIGVSLCELGRLKTSRTILEKTMELYPDDPITLANIAGLNWEEGDVGKSIFYYSKSLENDPTIIETHFNLINLYYEQGDLFMAYIACLNLLNIYPDNIQAKEIRDDIILDMGLSIF